MDQRFDYATYWELLARVARTHRVVRFADVRSSLPPEPFCILRHDVDYSTGAALDLAELESCRGIQASYFLLPNGLYYNLLDPAHAHVPRRLVELGHEVGLHYDINLFRALPSTDPNDLLRVQLSLLSTLSGAPVVSIAMHQPGLNGADPLRNQPNLLNAYDDRFFHEMTYISDSCRAWRDESWNMLNSARLPNRLQLALHPINWGPHDRTRIDIFRSVHRQLAASVEAAGDDLLEKINRHTGVLEHEARGLQSRQREDPR